MAASMCTLPLATSRVLYSKQLQQFYHRLYKGAVLTSLHQYRGKVHVGFVKQVSRTFSQRCVQCRSLSSKAPQLDDEATEKPISNDSLALREKPKDYLAWKPVDDVYMRTHYPPQPQSFHDAMETLREQDKWMFCRCPQKYSDRTVTISVNLDMALKKKKKVDPFQNMLILPHTFKPDNIILCFARGSDVQAAIDAGADIVGDEEIVPKVLSKEIKNFDFCVSTPDMMTELVSLKRLLRKRFPNSKRGSVGPDLGIMIHTYKKGQEYKCQIRGSHVNCTIGKLSLTNEQLDENMQCIITDICKRKPPQFGPFVTKLTVNAFLLDGILLDFEKYLPAPVDELESLDLNPDQEKVSL